MYVTLLEHEQSPRNFMYDHVDKVASWRSIHCFQASLQEHCQQIWCHCYSIFFQSQDTWDYTLVRPYIGLKIEQLTTWDYYVEYKIVTVATNKFDAQYYKARVGRLNWFAHWRHNVTGLNISPVFGTIPWWWKHFGKMPLPQENII